MPTLTPQLRAEYQNVFDTCQVRPDRQNSVEHLASTLIQNKERYQSLEALTDVPWYIIAVIHNMEASQKFNGHLHNGDPLTARTVQVPKGRPPFGMSAMATICVYLLKYPFSSRIIALQGHQAKGSL